MMSSTKKSRGSAEEKNSAPITDFIAQKKREHRRKQGGDLKKNSSSSNDLFGLVGERKTKSGSIRKSFNDLQKMVKSQQHDHATMVFTGRMMAKKNAWADPATQAFPDMKRASSNKSLRSGTSPSRSPARSRSSKKKLDHTDVDRIHQLVTHMKQQGPDGQKLLQEFVKKQAGAPEEEFVPPREIQLAM